MTADELAELGERGRVFSEMFPGTAVSDDWRRHSPWRHEEDTTAGFSRGPDGPRDAGPSVARPFRAASRGGSPAAVSYSARSATMGSTRAARRAGA
jgi:hypothetical protein